MLTGYMRQELRATLSLPNGNVKIEHQSWLNDTHMEQASKESSQNSRDPIAHELWFSLASETKRSFGKHLLYRK